MRTDMTKLIMAFRNFAKLFKNYTAINNGSSRLNVSVSARPVIGNK
jgi:hypothetical protein